uniref:Uncharacterized protein n=1 Tax=Rhizophora mucronata TaxID=61149 RepID=A0A2P2KZY7_RHIMU
MTPSCLLLSEEYIANELGPRILQARLMVKETYGWASASPPKPAIPPPVSSSDFQYMLFALSHSPSRIERTFFSLFTEGAKTQAKKDGGNPYLRMLSAKTRTAQKCIQELKTSP